MLGAEHPSTLTSMANLASTYMNQGQWKEAEIGLVYRDMGKLEDARRYLASALEGMQAKLDPGSLFIRKTAQELAEVEEEQRQESMPATQTEQSVAHASMDEQKTEEASRQSLPPPVPNVHDFPDAPTHESEEVVAEPLFRQQVLVAE